MDNTWTSFPGFEVKIVRRLFSILYSHLRRRRSLHCDSYVLRSIWCTWKAMKKRVIQFRRVQDELNEYAVMLFVLIERIFIERSVLFLPFYSLKFIFPILELFSLALPCPRFQSSWCAPSLHNHYVNYWPPTGTNVLLPPPPPPVNTQYARPSGRWTMNLMKTNRRRIDRRRVLAGRAHWKQTKPIKCWRCKCTQWRTRPHAHIVWNRATYFIRFTSYLLMCMANAIASIRQSVASRARHFYCEKKGFFPVAFFRSLRLWTNWAEKIHSNELQ